VVLPVSGLHDLGEHRVFEHFNKATASAFSLTRSALSLADFFPGSLSSCAWVSLLNSQLRVVQWCSGLDRCSSFMLRALVLECTSGRLSNRVPFLRGRQSRVQERFSFDFERVLRKRSGVLSASQLTRKPSLGDAPIAHYCYGRHLQDFTNFLDAEAAEHSQFHHLATATVHLDQPAQRFI
jgi:hypothetical protein